MRLRNLVFAVSIFALLGLPSPEPTLPRPFESTLELDRWLAQNTVSEREWIKDVYDCDDFMEDLAVDAARDGYLLGIAYSPSGKGHYHNFALVGKGSNPVHWRIEPQTDVRWQKGRVDEKW